MLGALHNFLRLQSWCSKTKKIRVMKSLSNRLLGRYGLLEFGQIGFGIKLGDSRDSDGFSFILEVWPFVLSHSIRKLS